MTTKCFYTGHGFHNYIGDAVDTEELTDAECRQALNDFGCGCVVIRSVCGGFTIVHPNYFEGDTWEFVEDEDIVTEHAEIRG